MTKNKAKQELYGECLAYVIFGQEINPNRVEDMIKESFKAGYKEAIEYLEFYKLAEKHLGEDEFYMLIEKWNEGDLDE